MTVNEGTFDRAARVVVGLAVLSLTVVGPRSMWGLVGLVPILTGLLGVCPAYTILGINTCRAPRKA